MEENFTREPGARCGFVAIVGRPNVGKSTLLNALVGEKVAIVTPRPNTTRNRIAGILTKEERQAIFLDTPGIHHARDALNKRMVSTAMAALADVDIVLFMVEAGVKILKIEEFIAKKIAETNARRMLIINKTDKIPKRALLPEIEERTGKLGDFEEIVPISALAGDGVEIVEKLVLDSLPPNPHYYPPDVYTDQPERFVAAEMIRERIFLATRQEVPYATAVSIEEWDEREHLVRIAARIHVETKSQKGIIIGKRGAMLKKIGSEARAEIEKLLGTGVFLELFVHVMPKWRRNEKSLDRLGYTITE